jgi:hypothetical protein
MQIEKPFKGDGTETNEDISGGKEGEAGKDARTKYTPRTSSLL